LVNKCFTKASLIVFIAIALNSIAAAEDSQASDRQEIRFYKIHKGGATQRIRFTAKKAKRPGCHNFLRRARLHVESILRKIAQKTLSCFSIVKKILNQRRT